MSDETMDNNSLDDQFDEADVFADFDMGNEPPQGRKPASPAKAITKNVLNIASSFTESAAQEVENSLPRTSSLIGEVKSFKDDLEALKSDVQRELKPTVNAVKRAMHKSMPLAKDFLPKKLYDLLDSKLKDWEEDQIKRRKSREEMQAEEIEATLADIFGAQEDIRKDERQEALANQLVDRVMESKRHKDQIGALTAIDSKLLFQSDFIRTTQSAWMKKMLELQYIHVFTAKEHVAVSKVVANILENKLEEIKHNTSLPDLVKTKRSEYIRSLVRGRTLAKIGDVAGNYLTGVRQRVGKFAQEKILGGIRATRELADQAAGAADMAASAKEMAESSGMEMPEGKGAAGLAGKLLGIPVGRRLATLFAPMLGELEDASGNIKETAYFKAQQFKKRLEGSGNIAGEFLSTLIPEHQEKRTIQNQLLDDPFGPISFDVGTRQAIVEVIPGYLSSIDKSLRDLVTGEPTEAREFDVVSRTFTTASKAAESSVSRSFGDERSRSQSILNVVGAFKGATVTKQGETGKEAFERVQRDVFAFVTNSAIKNIFLEPAMIKEYAESDVVDPKESNNYIAQTFEGLQNPKATAQVLVSAMYNGEILDDIPVRAIERAISRAIQSEAWKDILPQFLEAHGKWGQFREMGALDENNNIKDEFLRDVLLNVGDERFESEVGMASGSMERNLRIRKEQKELMRETVGDKLPSFVTSLADKIASWKNGGLLRNMASFFSSQADTIEQVDLGGVMNDVKTAVKASGGDYLEKVKSAATGARGKVDEAGTAIKGRLEDVDTDELKDQGRRVGESAKDFASRMMAMGKEKMSPVVEAALNAMPEMSTVQEKVSDSVSDIKDVVSDMVDRSTGTKEQPMVTSLVDQYGNPLGISPDSVGEGSTSEKVYDFHQDFLSYWEYRQTQDAALLDAILNEGKGSSKIMDKLGKAGGALGRGGKAVLKMYGDIYGAAFKAGGHALGKGFDFGKAALPWIGKGVGGLGQLAGKGIEAYGNIYSGMLKGAGSLGGGAMSMVGGLFGGGGGKKKNFFDVYRADEIEIGNPLVSARVQRKYAVKANGAILERTADITEPIMHRKTNETLVTQEDIDAGLVDQYGKPITEARGDESEQKKSGGGALGGLFKGLGSLGQGAMGLGSTLLGGYFDIYKGLFGLGSDAVKGVAGMFKKKDKDAAVVERLDTIIEILRDRMPPPRRKIVGDFDGDGDRDGSYQDIMNEKKRLEAKRKLAAAVGAGGAVKGAVGEDRDEEDGEPGLLDAYLGSKGLGKAWGWAKKGGKWLGATKLGTAVAGKWAAAGGAKGLASAGFAKAGGTQGLGAAAKTAGPLAALAQMTYGGVATGLDDERAEAHSQDLMARQEAINKKLGIFGYGGLGTVGANFGVDKWSENYKKGGFWGGTKETGKGLLTGFVRMGDNIGAAANMATDAYQESQGPDEYRQLLEALKNQEYVKDPWGWGKWKVLDWDKMESLAPRDLLLLYGHGEEHFNDDDVNKFRELYVKKRNAIKEKEKKRKELEKQEAEEKEQSKGVLEKPATEATAGSAASPTSATYKKSQADIAAQEVEMKGKSVDKYEKTIEELQSLAKQQMSVNQELVKTMKEANGHLEGVSKNTGELGNIKEGLDKNLEKATEAKPVVVNNPPPAQPKVSIPSLSVAKTV